MKKDIIYSEKNNFLKKIIIKLLRKFDYEIIDQNTGYLPISNLKITDNLSLFNKSHTTIPLGRIKTERKIKNLLIIFRSFTNEQKLLSQNKKRIFCMKKQEYTLRSLNSICKSIKKLNLKIPKFKIFLKIIDDNSDKKIIKIMKKIIDINKVNGEISNLNVEKYINKMKFSNNKRMLAHNSHIYESKNYALNSNYDLIYFVEDDYLHCEDFLEEMIYTYQKFSSLFKRDIILCPSDYPYLYLKNPNSNIFIGHKKHWRQVRESLCTYIISKNILKKKWNNYFKMFTNNHDPYEKELHNIYKKELCFSPMPSLAIHTTNINSVYGMSPLLNYFKLWKANNYK